MLTEISGKRTKIVATLGPSSNDKDTIRQMIRAGIDVARINFSHGTQEENGAVIALVREVAAEENAVVGIMADLQGPKIRLGDLPHPIEINPGDRLVLTCRPNPDQSKGYIPLPHPDCIQDVRPGDRLLLDDGEIELIVRNQTAQEVTCEVIIGGELKSRKGVAAPDSNLKSLSSLTDKDKEDLVFALDQGVDFVAMSFVRTGDDMRQLRWLVEYHKADVWLIAKIEKFEALQNFDDIVQHSDGIMVARGDLGVEIPAAEVPIKQKRIIRRCNQLGKPVITATQMLNSMIENPRPTRAEASDVANAIFDGTDAIMLSGETAAGKYPIQAVKTMADIARIAEKHLRENNGATHKYAARDGGQKTIADAISHATREMAEVIGAKMIITCTWTGYTARRVARERPSTPIVCATPNKNTYLRASLIWGVLPIYISTFDTIDEMIKLVLEAVHQYSFVERDDNLVIIAGVPFGAGGQTNFVKIHTVP